MKLFRSLAEAEDFIFKSLGKNIHLATPLGLGKPNQLINNIYTRACADKSIRLKIWTALSLDFESPSSFLEEKFLGPFYKRHFGDDYPHLKYVKDAKKNTLPANISLNEFYFQAGAFLKSQQAQRAYISLNYTHATPAIFQHDVNVVVQLIAKRGDKYSLSCNPDLTLDVKDYFAKRGRRLLMIGVVHPDLPFMGGDAEVAADFFDGVVESSEVQHQLFGLPKTSADEAEHLIGFYASQLVEDDGTLQIGIGSLSDALVHSMILRHQKNDLYRRIFSDIYKNRSALKAEDLHQNTFEKGLYGTSEMVMDGFMHLRREGILKREIFDHEESQRRYLHGAFFLGSKDFYQWLKNLQGSEYSGLSMTRVSKVNDLYDPHEMALRRQRKKARFFNTCMNVSLLGAAASDTIESGAVVSGVGGQYNFVAMAHELEEARSILMLRSVREKNGRRYSNIVTEYGQCTIPRHLRDIVITEYGIAFLRGESDETVIRRLIEIADSEFQEELAVWAKKNKKLSQDYEVPEYARHNTPQRVKEFVRKYQKENIFAPYPFGSDFTDVELRLGKVLLGLKKASLGRVIACLLKGLFKNKDVYQDELKRLQLVQPGSVKEFVFQKIVLGSLK